MNRSTDQGLIETLVKSAQVLSGNADLLSPEMLLGLQILLKVN